METQFIHKGSPQTNLALISVLHLGLNSPGKCNSHHTMFSIENRSKNQGVADENICLSGFMFGEI